MPKSHPSRGFASECESLIPEQRQHRSGDQDSIEGGRAGVGPHQLLVRDHSRGQGIRSLAKFPAAGFFAENKILTQQLPSSAISQSCVRIVFPQGQLS